MALPQQEKSALDWPHENGMIRTQSGLFLDMEGSQVAKEANVIIWPRKKNNNQNQKGNIGAEMTVVSART